MSENGARGESIPPEDFDELNDLVREALRGDSSPSPPNGGDPDPREGQSFGRFERLTLVGRGGFGTVHRAYDAKHHRFVALKIPHQRSAVDPALLRRFRVEAEAVAKIDHPGVAALYEVGEVDGLPYLASAYCDGPDLSRWRRSLKARGLTVDSVVAARIALATAKALTAAHAAGVIHRDLKPSNIILQPTDDAGDVTVDGRSYRVRIVDFGMAKLFRESDEQTRTDFHVGTPPYMAPEQFSRRFGTISPRTDVYGLGATLYALLAGQAPFKADEPIELYAQILTDPPPSLTTLRPSVPKDLAAVCRRCLEKTATDRYATARDVAEELERYLQGRRVRANWSWLRKALLGSTRRRTASGVSALVLIGAVAWFVHARIEHHRRKHETEADKAKRFAGEKEELEYLSAVQHAFADYNTCNAAGIRAFVKRYADKVQFHNVEWGLLKRLSDTAVWTVQTDSQEVHSTAISPDPANPFVCCGLHDGRVQVRRESDGTVVTTLHGHTKAVDWLELLDTGRVLASCGGDGFVRTWDTRSWKLRTAFKAHDDWIASATVSPDGKYFVTCGADRLVNIWTLPDFEKAGSLAGHEHEVRHASFSEDGRYLVTGGKDKKIILWDFAKRERIRDLPEPANHFWPENNWTRHVHFVGDVQPYRIAGVFFTGEVVQYQFSEPSNLKVWWEGRLGARRSYLRPGGNLLYFTRRDGALARVSLAYPDTSTHVLGVGHDDNAFSLGAQWERGLYATGDRAGQLRFWSDRRDSLGWTYFWFRGDAGFAGDDHVVIESSVGEKELLAFRAGDGSQIPLPSLLKGQDGITYGPYGRMNRFPGEVWRYSPAGWQRASLLDGSGPTRFEVPERWRGMRSGPLPWVTDKERKRLQIFSIDLSRSIADLSLRDGFKTADLSSDARWIVCEYDEILRLYSMAPPHREISLEDADNRRLVGTVAFSPGGDYLASPIKAGGLVVWSTETGKRHATIAGRREEFRKAIPTADGKRVFTIDRNGRLSLWDAAHGMLLGSFLAGLPDVTRADIEMDSKGRRLLVFLRRGLDVCDSVRMINLSE